MSRGCIFMFCFVYPWPTSLDRPLIKSNWTDRIYGWEYCLFSHVICCLVWSRCLIRNLCWKSKSSVLLVVFLTCVGHERKKTVRTGERMFSSLLSSMLYKLNSTSGGEWSSWVTPCSSNPLHLLPLTRLSLSTPHTAHLSTTDIAYPTLPLPVPDVFPFYEKCPSNLFS